MASSDDAEARLVWARDVDLDEKMKEQEAKAKGTGWRPLTFLAFSTLGVVYGDIGTSPLYVFSSTFPNGAPDDENMILGTFSMIFWTITSVVLVKYVLLMLRADDRGEGGIISLYSLIKRAARVPTPTDVHSQMVDLDEEQRPKSKVASWLQNALSSRRWAQISLLVLVLLAVNMIISDGVLTPAISVISAVEGIQYNTGISNGAVVGITVAILVVLFVAQSFGTQRVSAAFSPIILLWFTANFVIGIYNLVKFRPSAAKGLSPSFIYYYWSGDAHQAWRNLGNVMLSITGAEALYADLGHFSARSIQLSFIAIVYPSLTLTYLGQTAYILENKPAAATAFWSSQPSALYVPMVILATLAAIIASQALITGAFSITKQGIALRCFPRFSVKHTSEHNEGQVYIAEINYALLVFCVIIVAAFQTSTRIGNAYGLAIITVMTIDTFLLSLLMLLSWAWHWAIVATFFLVYIFISCAYLSSNLEKIPHGAWFSIVLSGILSVISYVYWWGTAKKASYVRKHAIPLTDLFEKSSGGRGGVLRVTAGAANMALPPLAPSSAPVPGSGDENLTVQLHSGVKPLRLVGTKLPVGRVPGLGLYYSELLEGVPPVLVRFLTLCPAIHETVVFVTVRRVLLPRVREDERLLVRKLEVPGFYHIVARYGYGESIDQGPAFVKMAVEEVVEYLAAGGIIDEIASETSDVADLEAAMASPRSQAESDAAPMSMNTVAGQRMLAAIRSRLRGEAAPAPEDPLSAENASSDASVRGKDEGASSVVATGTRLLVSSSMSMRHRSGRTSAASELSPRPGTPGKPNYPWVRQPTSFNRLGSAREKALDRVKALGGSWDSSATVPLPPPPPRPCIHRSSASGIVSDAVDAAVSTLVGTPSATMAGRAAADLGQQLKQARGAGADKKGGEEAPVMLSEEQEMVTTAYSHGVVQFVGKADLVATSKGRSVGNWFKGLVTNGIYGFLVANARPASAEYQMPMDTVLEMRVRYEI